MRTKKILIILVIFVGSLMLMNNALAATGPPPVWANQVTLSIFNDEANDLDPENSGYGPVQVAVWVHETTPLNGNIYMKYSLADGAPGSWVFSPIWPASSNMDERNPAVSVTREHPVTGQEIHVVYERNNGVNWEICHTYTNNFGVGWSPVTKLSTAGLNAYNPAICYTEDLAPGPGGGGVIGFINQIVWNEPNTPPIPGIQIVYNAHIYDPTLPRRYVTVPPASTTIRSSPGDTSNIPEIASVDDTTNGAAYDYYFGVVWQEFTVATGQTNIWYVDGTTTTSPGPGTPSVALTAGSLGIINPPAPFTTNHYEPDIAATQAYLLPETYYFHVTYVKITITPMYTIESHWSYGAVATPGSASFVMVVPSARGAAVAFTLDKPTVASKLISQVVPPSFESWLAWEDSNMPGSIPDIWFAMGQNLGGGVFAYMGGPARVPYAPLGAADSEYNPEFWNRNDAIRLLPPVTHLVFDRDPHPIGGFWEVEYIDP